MTLSGVLLAPSLLAALVVYGLLSLGLAWLVARVEDGLDHGVQAWLWLHLFAPLLRAAALGVFIILAYPTLFGLDDAPPVTTLLLADDARPGHLVGALFAISLALPLAPLRLAGPALVLPLQGMAGATLLFGWLAEALALEPQLWVGLPNLGLILVLAVATHLAAARLLDGVHHAGHALLGVADLEVLVRELLVLLVQVPVVLVYTLALGANLAAAGAAA